MGLRQTEAYALRTYDLGEADLIVVFFTREYGQVRGVAKGARRVRSRFGSAFQTLTRSQLVYYQKEGKSLARISSCEIVRSYYEALAGLEEGATAAYMAELLQEFAPERQPEPDLYRLVGAVLDAVSDGVSLNVAARYFEVWVLRLAGLLPRLSVCGSCEKPLGPGRWVAEEKLEFICGRRCGDVKGSRRLSPSGTSMLQAILGNKPREVDERAAGQRRALQRLALVNRVLIRGNLGKDLRSYRYLDRLRRAVRRTGRRAGAGDRRRAVALAGAGDGEEGR